MTDRRPVRLTLVALASLFLIMQIVPVERTNPIGREDAALQAPADVAGLLVRACYDCHSHETTWPPYAFVAPASWLVARHVSEGRENLNFSQWEEQTGDEAEHSLEEIAEVVESHEMPLGSYLWLHREARLSENERATIVSWANSERESLRSR